MTVPVVQHHCTDVFMNSFKSDDKIKDKVILDSGCGDGYASKQFAKRGAAHVNSYDPSAPIVLDYVDERISTFNSIEWIGTFCDIAWTHHVIEHVHSPETYLTTLRNRMRDDGELWLTCPNTATHSTFSYGHVHNFTIANMVLTLQKACFGVEDIKWMLTAGQLRVRVPRIGGLELPKPFKRLLERNQHFPVGALPQTWRWNEE